MNRFKRFIYQYFIYLPLIFVAHLIALFNRNVRQAILGRYRSARDLKNFSTGKKPVVYFHAASLGEFEHIRPLIFYLGKTYQIVVTFFSPSGYNHAKKQFDDEIHYYLPFDFYGLWFKILKRMQPKFLVISKHDIWANQILAANRLQIPTFLVNASLSAKSSRLNVLYRFFYAPIYRQIDMIFTISDEDQQRFVTYFKLQNVRVVGDTKFDQVIIRKEQAQTKNYIPKEWVQNFVVIALGSIWPEDYAVLSAPLQQLMQEFKELKILFVPHQPHEAFLQRIETDFGKFGTRRFTDQTEFAKERSLVVNVVGILADLYKYAQIAYVGGSFKQGIHNVMEPGTYGIPVIYGPKHKNSYEATQLVREGASFVVQDESEAFKILKKLITDEAFRRTSGKKVQRFVERHTGATQRILQALPLNERPDNFGKESR